MDACLLPRCCSSWSIDSLLLLTSDALFPNSWSQPRQSMRERTREVKDPPSFFHTQFSFFVLFSRFYLHMMIHQFPITWKHASMFFFSRTCRVRAWNKNLGLKLIFSFFLVFFFCLIWADQESSNNWHSVSFLCVLVKSTGSPKPRDC